MREAVFILIVIAVLLGLTLLRYRKQIKGMIGLARTLREIREAASVPRNVEKKNEATALVNCSSCGVWVPEGRALQAKGVNFCSETCLVTRAVK